MDVVVATINSSLRRSPRVERQLPEANQVALVWHRECPARTVDQYRRVAHSLRRVASERNAKLVAITSALPQEGKTLSTVNLAVSLSESYRQRVLIIDADLRLPSVMKLLDVDRSAPDLTHWLVQDAEGPYPIVPITDTLAVIPASPAQQEDPVTLLTQPRFIALLASVREQFDCVLIDTPPAGLLCDASVFDEYIDGFIVVVAAGRARYTLVQESIAALGEQRVLGVLLNRVLVSIHGESDKYADYYRRSLSVPKPQK